MANTPGRAPCAEAPNATDHQTEELHKLTPRELREWYRELFGAESTSRCKQQLVRRLSWKLQALAHGDLSERARCRIATESGALPAPSSGASFEISQDPN